MFPFSQIFACDWKENEMLIDIFDRGGTMFRRFSLSLRPILVPPSFVVLLMIRALVVLFLWSNLSCKTRKTMINSTTLRHAHACHDLFVKFTD